MKLRIVGPSVNSGESRMVQRFSICMREKIIFRNVDTKMPKSMQFYVKLQILAGNKLHVDMNRRAIRAATCKTWSLMYMRTARAQFAPILSMLREGLTQRMKVLTQKSGCVCAFE